MSTFRCPVFAFAGTLFESSSTGGDKCGDISYDCGRRLDEEKCRAADFERMAEETARLKEQLQIMQRQADIQQELLDRRVSILTSLAAFRLGPQHCMFGCCGRWTSAGRSCNSQCPMSASDLICHLQPQGSCCLAQSICMLSHSSSEASTCARAVPRR